MYILVRQSDNVIVGTAIRPIDELSASKSGCRIYEIDESEFTPEMLGSKLTQYNKE